MADSVSEVPAWMALLGVDKDAPVKAEMPWAYMTLKTGVPGSGKSLTIVDELRKVCESENPPTVYIHGIPDLALPHIPLPVFAPLVEQKGDDGKPQKVFSRTLEVDWSSVVSGSLVVIDEAQQVFPVRASTGKIPGYVSFLNTHRHRAILIVLITQHPKNIDQKVRVLIGKHQHYRRVFGGGRHICYEWDSCSDTLSGMKTATKSLRSFPKKAFAAYKSAEQHHKPKFAFPIWLAVPVIALLGLVAVAPTTYKSLHGAFTGTGVVGAAGKADPVARGQDNSLGGHAVAGRSAGAQIEARLAYQSVRVAAYPVGYIHGETQPDEIAGCWIADECVCVYNGAPRRLVRDLGQLCVDVASGKLLSHPFRVALALAASAAASASLQNTAAVPSAPSASAVGRPAAGA